MENKNTCDCIFCKYRDNPEVLKDIYKYTIRQDEYILEVLKHSGVKSGTLDGSSYSLETLRAVIECNLEESRILLDEINKETKNERRK